MIIGYEVVEATAKGIITLVDSIDCAADNSHYYDIIMTAGEWICKNAESINMGEWSCWLTVVCHLDLQSIAT